LRLFTRTATETRKITDSDKHFEVLYDAFARSVESGRLLELASGVDGLKATEAAFQALAATTR
jgi:hypothetical protein